MKSALIALLILTTHVFGLEPSRTQALAAAIAKAEGFYVKGSVPNRTRNPGDIRAVRGEHFPGQIGLNVHGYIIFKNNEAGWAALRHQLDKIVAGESRYYTVNNTLKQLSKRYATSPTWVRNVSKNLGVTPGTTLFEILDVPPALSFAPNQHVLESVLTASETH